MIVVFFSRVFYPHVGGVEKHVFEISKILVKKGYKIIVFTEHFINRSSEYEKAVYAGYKWASQQSWQKVTDLYIKLWKHEGIFRNNCS